MPLLVFVLPLHLALDSVSGLLTTMAESDDRCTLSWGIVRPGLTPLLGKRIEITIADVEDPAKISIGIGHLDCFLS